MKPLARLYFVIPFQHRDAFHAGYASRLAPILTRHGIVPTIDTDRPIAKKDKPKKRYGWPWNKSDPVLHVGVRGKL